MTSERDRAVGALAGLALGDALGMPTESMSRQAIAARYGRVITLLDGEGDRRVGAAMPAGSVTDDTEQALMLARLLVDGRGQVEAVELAAVLERWEADMARRRSAGLLGPIADELLALRRGRTG